VILVFVVSSFRSFVDRTRMSVASAGPLPGLFCFPPPLFAHQEAL